MTTTKNILVKALSLVFLAGYLVNVISFQSFHQAVHHYHNHELHTAEAEADACHRVIYHCDITESCGHKNHITEGQANCELCNVLTSRNSEFIPNDFLYSFLLEHTEKRLTSGSMVFVESRVSQSQLRGPPIV